MMVDLKACFILDRSNDPSSPPRRPNALYRNEMWPVTTVLCVPRYCSMALFDKVHARRVAAVSIPNSTVEIQEVEEQEEEKFIEFEDVERWWKELTATYHDDHAIVFKIMQKSNMQNYLSPQDFQPIVDEVVQRHPGLEFLSTLAVFQARYAETVITRIFYSKINNCNERMTLAEFRKHAFLELLIKLQLDDDINSTRDVFSYKHFYVIYCKFWELDTDHNMIIEASDMFRYGRGALTDMMMKRVVSGYGKPLALGNASKKISYKDFIWFMLCVEDKRKVGSIEYWFRCLDVDSDGMLSLYELCEFYEQQVKRMIDFRMSEPWKLDDFICSLLDLIKPKNPNYLTLSDLKRTPQNAALFFDMLFDLRKYDNHVRRIDPMYREMDDVWIEEEVVVGSVGGGAGGCLKRVKLEGWDKFAERAYELLAYEEAGGGGDGGGGGGGNADAVDGNGIGGRGSGVGGGVRNLEDDDEEDMEGGHWSCYLGKDDEDEDVDEDEDHDVINGWATELGTSRDEKMHMLDEDEEEEEDVAQGVKRLMSYHSGLSIDEQLLSEAGRENRLRGVKNTRH
ncbi:hypothetical protein BDR26DRAFT_125111 [Obelidium mucronatum]|nr:hypothetical protein BDR26DRAFT_125111 [Obelidium mucronatum]